MSRRFNAPESCERGSANVRLNCPSANAAASRGEHRGTTRGRNKIRDGIGIAPYDKDLGRNLIRALFLCQNRWLGRAERPWPIPLWYSRQLNRPTFHDVRGAPGIGTTTKVSTKVLNSYVVSERFRVEVTMNAPACVPNVHLSP
jgi:hypothetical protein